MKSMDAVIVEVLSLGQNYCGCFTQDKSKKRLTNMCSHSLKYTTLSTKQKEREKKKRTKNKPKSSETNPLQ